MAFKNAFRITPIMLSRYILKRVSKFHLSKIDSIDNESFMKYMVKYPNITSHIKIITPAAQQFIGLSTKVAARILQSSIMFCGVSLITNKRPKGTIIISSKYPSTGIKSGIKSIGDRA